MKAGSYFPGKHYSSLYAMAGDDCSLFYDLAELTEKQQADHLSNVELTAMLQVALIAIGHGQDHVALYEDYRAPGWQDALARYHDFFTRMLPAPVVPLTQVSYHPKYTYYDSVAGMARDNPSLTDVVNLYMTSGSNAVIHQDDDSLTVSRNVNSKVHFANHAPDYGIPVPATMVTSKGELDTPLVSEFFETHDNRVMIKLLGLAGARNVAPVTSVAECLAYVAEYQDDMVVLLQAQLDLKQYTEMTVDLVVSHEEVRIANIRKILFADGLWVGNLIGQSVSLNDEQTAALIKVGEYARHHGYVSDEGSNCGVDFFIGGDGSLIVTEINARWTGGLFPAEILSRIGDARDAVPFFDMVLIEKREAYLDFVDRHLVGEYEGAFAIVPIGFGCFPVPMDGQDYFYTWQAVLGDLEAFKAVKQRELGEGALITADIIKL